MKYLLRKAAGAVPDIEITEDEYVKFEKAHKILSSALAFETKYEILIANYLDFEKQILNLTADFMVRNSLDYSDFFKVRLGLNIRLVNLLTAARLYVDQIKQDIPKCVPDVSDAKIKVVNLFETEYGGNKEYQFMEALRNYVQHRGIPVHLAVLNSKRTYLDDDRFMEYSMELASLRRYLKEDSIFKQDVLKDLDEKIDLKAATRSYVESISNVHESARSIIAKSVKSARELIEGAHYRYLAVYSESLVGLNAEKWEDERQVSTVPLLLEWDDIRVELQKRNRKLTNLRKRYATGIVNTQNK
ncbi:MAG: hypothetical protein ACYSWY_09530 [Planctomycetota bacterium]|jgi:hypothetical protein